MGVKSPWIPGKREEEDTKRHILAHILIYKDEKFKSYLGQKTSHSQKREKQARIHLPLHLLRTGEEKFLHDAAAKSFELQLFLGGQIIF